MHHLSCFFHILFDKLFGWLSTSTTNIVIYDYIEPFDKVNVFKRKKLRKTSFNRGSRNA